MGPFGYDVGETSPNLKGSRVLGFCLLGCRVLGFSAFRMQRFRVRVLCFRAWSVEKHPLKGAETPNRPYFGPPALIVLAQGPHSPYDPKPSSLYYGQGEGLGLPITTAQLQGLPGKPLAHNYKSTFH